MKTQQIQIEQVAIDDLQTRPGKSPADQRSRTRNSHPQYS